MPELPEVETIKNGMINMLGKEILQISQSNYQLRYQGKRDFHQVFARQIINKIERRAKYIIISFKETDKKILIHLGMSGSIIINPEIRAKHEHFRILFTDESIAVYNDARRFGMIDYFTQNHFLLDKLGIEPFDTLLNGDYCHKIYHKHAVPIKNLLLNQQYIVGIGNIYASEILFLAKIHPQRLATTIKPNEYDLLAKYIREVLQNAINAGGSSFSDYKNANGELGYFQHEWLAYGKAGKACSLCADSEIQKIQQSMRASYFCANHQI